MPNSCRPHRFACPLAIIPVTAAHAKSSGPAATPGPVLVSGPCASITLPKPSDSLNIAGKTSAVMKLSATLKSCFQRVAIAEHQRDRPAYQNWGGADCSIAPFTLGPAELRSGDTKTFTFNAPEPPAMICTHMFTETLVDSSGTTLGTVTQRFDTVSHLTRGPRPTGSPNEVWTPAENMPARPEALILANPAARTKLVPKHGDVRLLQLPWLVEVRHPDCAPEALGANPSGQ